MLLMMVMISAFLCLLGVQVQQAAGVPLGLLGADGGYAASSPPYLASFPPLHYPRHYLHLDHLHHGLDQQEGRSPPPAPRGVRPVLLTRPVPQPDPRPPPRPHPYSLLYLHFVPLARLAPQPRPQQRRGGVRHHHRPYRLRQ